MFEIKLEGDWKKTQRILAKLPIDLKVVSLQGQRKAAEKIARIAKAHINNQDLGWAPRADNTKSLDDRILVDSETYLRSIKAWRAGNTYYVGVPKGTYNYRGIDVADYAVYHEYGFGKNIARPLWGPSFRDVGGKKGVTEIIVKAMAERIRKSILAG